MDFIKKNKFLTLLIVLLIAYIIRNPGGKFGIARTDFVIYNRLPVAWFDFYVGLDGKSALVESVHKQDALENWWKKIQELSRYNEPEPAIFIVGTGFPGSTRFHLPEKYYEKVLAREITLRKVPSDKAVSLYNLLRERNEKVAILLKIRSE